MVSDKDSLDDEAQGAEMAPKTEPPGPSEAGTVDGPAPDEPSTVQNANLTDTNMVAEVAAVEVEEPEPPLPLKPIPEAIDDSQDETSVAIEEKGSSAPSYHAPLDEPPIDPTAPEITRPPLLERMGVLPAGTDGSTMADFPADLEPTTSVSAEVAPEVYVSDAPRPAQDFASVHADAISALISVAAIASKTAAVKRYVAPPQAVFDAPASANPVELIPEPKPEAVPRAEAGIEPQFKAELEPQTAIEIEAPAATRDPQPAPAAQAAAHQSWIKRAGWFAVRAAAAYSALLIALVALFRFVDPPGSALMAIRRIGGTQIEQTWVPISTMSPHLVRAVVVSEDWTFCSHNGIDLEAIEQAIEKAGDGIPRGASTISMQVAKNMFLWPSKSYVRKAIELPLTLTMELMWPKRRILEVYLNVAEWGPGIFGAEAAAQHHFQKPASSLTAREAAQLAASLPNPFRRDAGDPGPQTARKAGVIQARMRIAGPVANCVLPSAKGS